MIMKFRYRFESAHRLTSSASPMCQTPHGHTWHATVHFRSTNHKLDNANMLAEFQKVKGPWKAFVRETLDHSFFHHHQDPILESLQTHIPNLRGLPIPGDPTTEMLAVLFLRKCESFAQAQTDIDLEPFHITVDETEVNTVELSTSDAVYNKTIQRLAEQGISGWWNSPEVEDRSIQF